MTETEYQKLLKAVESLMNVACRHEAAERDEGYLRLKPEDDQDVCGALRICSDLVCEYEDIHYPIREPSKEEADAFREEQEERK